MPKITGCAPVLLVRNVAKAAAYYRDQLGFDFQKLFGDPPYFAMVRRDGFTVMLAQTDQPVIPNWQVVEKMWDIYCWVDDVDAVYAELQSRGAIIDYSLYLAPHGVREFGVRDIDDHDIAFGQVVAPDQ